MSIKEINALYFELDTQSNELKPQSEGDIEWSSNQGEYKIILQTDNNIQFDNINFILADKNNNIKEVFKAEKIGLETFNGEYEAKSLTAPLIEGNSIIKLGVIYVYNEISYRTDPINIRILQSIGNNNELVAPENVPVNLNSFVDLLDKFDDAKAIEKIETLLCKNLPENVFYPTKNNVVLKPSSPDEDDNYCLLIYYKGEAKPTYAGLVSTDAIGLGLKIQSIGDNGGGGIVGDEASLGDVETSTDFSDPNNYAEDFERKTEGTKRGFAGGREAHANDGAAIGYNAIAENGFSAGPNARGDRTNIAIGNEAEAFVSEISKSLLEEEVQNGDNIAIGTKTSVVDSFRSIAIGRESQIKEGDSSILIGSAAEFSEGSLIQDSGKSKIENVGHNVGIGTNLHSKNNYYSILIGDKIKTERPKYSYGETADHIWNSIAIGREVAAAERGCVAIGAYAVSGGFKQPASDNPVVSSYHNYTTSEPAAIAIGRYSCAYGHCSIAIGKHTYASRYGSVAIGKFAEAGPNYENYEKLSENDDGKDGVKAIAIGYGAKAKANNAVQIGQGTNTTPNSVYFGYKGTDGVNYNTCIIKDGKLQVNLGLGNIESNSGVSGILSVKNGGTGSNTSLGARQNLGFFTATFNRAPTLPWGFKNNTGRDFTFSFSEAKLKFASAPKVFLTLKMGKDELVSPMSMNYYIKEVTKDYVKVRLDYNAVDWDDTKKNAKDLPFSFEAIMIGDGFNT